MGPKRLGASARRDSPPRISSVGERHDVDFNRTGLVRAICQPPSVRRNGWSIFGEPGRHQRYRDGINPGTNSKNVSRSGLISVRAEDQPLAVGRPTRAEGAALVVYLQHGLST